MKVLQTNEFLTCEKLDIKPITADALKKLGSAEKSLKRKLGLSKIEPIEYYESQNGKYRECIRLKLTSKELDAFNDIMYEIMKDSLPSTLTYQKLHDCIPFTEGYNQLNSVTVYAVFYHLGVWEECIKVKHNPLETVLIVELIDKDKLNEKLNIQPVSKERLRGTQSIGKNTTQYMRSHLQTGDLLSISNKQGIGTALFSSGIFVGYDDYAKCGFSPSVANKDVNHSGCIINYYVDITKLSYTLLDEFDNDFVETTIRDCRTVIGVFRHKNIQNTNPIELVRKVCMSPTFDADGYELIWKRPKALDEKLDIQPVSKERLGKYGSVKKYRTAEEMSENFQLGDIIVEKANHGFVRHNIYVYMPKASNNDYECYTDIIFTTDKLHLVYDLLIGVNDKGVLTNKAFDYDKSLKEYLIDDYYNYVDAVYRIPDLTQPLPKEYFKNPPIRKAVCVWKRRKPFLNEKLDIQPMSASRLHSVGNTDDMIKHSLLKKLEKMKSSWWRTDMTKTYMKLTLTEKELGMLNTLIQEGMADYTYEQQSLIRDFLPLDFGKNDMMLPVWQNIFGLFDIINQDNISPNLRMIVDIKREK